MATAILAPTGVKGVTFETAVPYQVGTDHHLNVDESIALYNESDYLSTNNDLVVERHYLGTVGFTEAFDEVRIVLRHKAVDTQTEANADFLVWLGVSVLCPKKTLRITTAGGAYATVQVVWTAAEMNWTPTGTEWNNASERSMRIRTQWLPSGTGNPAPDPYNG